MGKLIAGKHTVHYLESAKNGPAVLFIHGSCGAGSQWTNLANCINGEFHTFQIDLPGCGQNSQWKAEDKWFPSVDTNAIDTLIADISGDIHIVLHSAGGHLAFQSLLNNNSRIKSLTMFEPTFFNLLKSHDRQHFVQPDSMAKTFKAHFEKGNIDSAMESFIDVWAKHTGTWESLSDKVKDTMKSSANRLYYEWDNIYGDIPALDDLNDLELPMLLLKGAETIESMHAVCDIVRSNVDDIQYVEIEGAGHMCPFTHTNKVALVLQEHLERHT